MQPRFTQNQRILFKMRQRFTKTYIKNETITAFQQGSGAADCIAT